MLEELTTKSGTWRSCSASSTSIYSKSGRTTAFFGIVSIKTKKLNRSKLQQSRAQRKFREAILYPRWRQSTSQSFKWRSTCDTSARLPVDATSRETSRRQQHTYSTNHSVVYLRYAIDRCKQYYAKIPCPGGLASRSATEKVSRG